jgi:hypothetical protein
MAFSIPPHYDRHLDRTKRAIEALIQRQVITSFDSSDLKTWLKNFDTDTDRYLASQLLDFMNIRSNKMIESMCHNAVEHTIMGLLRELEFWIKGDYESVLNKIKIGDKTLPFRFVVMDDFGKIPAKSGGQVFRLYSRSSAIHKNLAIQHKRISEQPGHVNLLIVLDDFSGTGTQFCDFCNEISLSTHTGRFKFAFIPLMAHQIAYEKINREVPFVTFRPVETLTEKHNFFGESSKSHGLWIRDEYNSVADVRQHYSDLLRNKNALHGDLPYSLNLAIGFDISTPNNTLNMFWTNQGTWKPLLKR